MRDSTFDEHEGETWDALAGQSNEERRNFTLGMPIHFFLFCSSVGTVVYEHCDSLLVILGD